MNSIGFDKKKYNREYSREWRKNNKDRKKKYDEEYRKTHSEYFKNYRENNLRTYNISMSSRATKLLYAYNQSDMKFNRGLGNIDAQWIVENIFTKSCVHCGETDWHKLGCNRLDNSKPHTKDNVEPCCSKCNKSLGGRAKKVV